jgi:hypothetical protein
MDEHDVLKDLDWSKVYSDVPESVSAGVQFAFLRIRARQKKRKIILRAAALAACLCLVVLAGGMMIQREGDAPDLLAAPRVELRTLSMDDRVYAAQADDYFHIHASCAAAMAEQVDVQLVTALEFGKAKCPICGANVLLP